MNPHVEVEIARRYLVASRQSVSRPNAGWRRQVGLGNETRSHPELSWNTLPSRILAASPHLQGYDVPGEEIDRLKAEGLTLLEALEELGIA
ncbi:MAG: hypothetical protein ACO390_00965 [bacterium]